MVVWPGCFFSPSISAAGNAHACSWNFEIICTISQQTDGTTQKWKDINWWWHLPEGPSIVPWMWSPVLWPKADCHLENLSIHHVCHHPQETWEAGIIIGIFVLMFFYHSWDSYCWKCFESSKNLFVVLLCLLFYCGGGSCMGRGKMTESSLFYIILNSQLREELKKENRWRKCCTISITTNLAAAKQGYATHKLSHLAHRRQASGKRRRREASVGNARLNVLTPNNDILLNSC